MQTLTALFLIVCLVLFPSVALPKDTERDLKNAARKIDKAAASPGEAEKVSKRLAEKFNVPSSTIKDLRARKLGFGEISILLALSQAIGKSTSQLLQRFRSGEGWGKIANKEGVKLGQVISAVERATPPASEAKSKSKGRGESADAQKGKATVEKHGQGGLSGVGLPGQSGGQGKGGIPDDGKGSGMVHGGGRK